MKPGITLASRFYRLAFIGDGGHQAEIVGESPSMVAASGCQPWSVYLPRRDLSGRYDYLGFPSLASAIRHVEAHPDFRRWVEPKGGEV